MYKRLLCACLLFFSFVVNIFSLSSLYCGIIAKIVTMKSAIILTALTAIVASQGIADLPTCSLGCLTTAISGLGCGITDFACSCQKASQLTPVVTPCVQSACSDPADQSKTIEVLAGICAAAGFPIEVPAPPAASSSAVPLPTPEPTAETTAEPTTQAPPASSSKAPVETQPSATDEPEYPEYPTVTDASSNFPGNVTSLPSHSSCHRVNTCSVPTHATNDVSNLPSAPSDHGSVPAYTNEPPPVSMPSPTSVSIPSVAPPYPSSKPASSASAPHGTGAPSHTSSGLPEFTGAAAVAQVPVVAAGVLGLAALVL